MVSSIRSRAGATSSAVSTDLLSRAATARLPTPVGDFQIYVYASEPGGPEHVALVHGDLDPGEGVLTRLHSSCLTGDVFHSARCDCGAQLERALERIADEGAGVLLYLDQEGRGIGLANKIRAYALQEQGLDTVEANVELGFDADLRDYSPAVDILRDLDVRSVRLLTNNPRKSNGLERHGMPVREILPLEIPPSASTLDYLRTKKLKLGHRLSVV
jgi:3,4-dihydroxy 2-butanone 4-phosphate synthase/GTP cyclohydrolase II